MNEQIAQRLLEVARILAEQNANVFRIQSYRRAARTIRNLSEPVADLVKREGLEGLDRLPGVGKSFRELQLRFSLALKSTGQRRFLYMIHRLVIPAAIHVP